jgi:ribose transport system permease protein
VTTPAQTPRVSDTGPGVGRALEEPSGKRLLAANAERFGLLVIFAIAILIFSLMRPDTFATVANWRAIATSESVLALSALSFMPALLCGRFDVSVGGQLALSSMACGALISRFSVPTLLAIVLGVLIGGMVGLFNGIIVAYFGVNSIIGTLAVSFVLGGVITAYSKGQAITNGIPNVFTNLGADLVFGIPTMFIIMLVISVLTWLLFTQTPFGRRVSALGSNISAARLSGIPIKRVMALSFMTGGLLAGCAGVMIIGQLGSANPNVGSLSAILPALAAVFLGATTWRPGKYTVLGTLIALFFVGTTISGLALLGTQPWVTDVFDGSAVVVAIAISAQFRRHRTGIMSIGE